MRLWDSSALVPVCVTERPSEIVHELADEDDAIVVWWGTPVECAAAFARRRREGTLSEAGYREALTVLGQLESAWVTMGATNRLRDRAQRLVGVHPLRAADALQLAAALVWAEESPAGRQLVSLDQRLCEAARREGFRVLPEEV